MTARPGAKGMREEAGGGVLEKSAGAGLCAPRKRLHGLMSVACQPNSVGGNAGMLACRRSKGTRQAQFWLGCRLML